MIQVIWDLDDDPNGNVQHIPINEYLTKDDVQHAVDNATWYGNSRTSERQRLIGPAENGLPLVLIYEQVDEDTMYPVTAYYIENP